MLGGAAWAVSACDGMQPSLWEARQDPTFVARSDSLARVTVDSVMSDVRLRRTAQRVGAVVFRSNCAVCHGSRGDARRGGCPDLRDDAWLWGGQPSQIEQTIAHGVRAPLDRSTRSSSMPRFDRVLSSTEMDLLAEFVSGKLAASPTSVAAERLYGKHCAVCHGTRGEGQTTIGAPRLTDDVHDQTRPETAFIRQVIADGIRGASMPDFQSRLSTGELRAVAVFVALWRPHPMGSASESP